MGVYGMTYDQFWYGDPWLAKVYREAHIERRRAENTRDWLLGAYFYSAVGTAIGNAFRKKGAKALNYLEEPFPIYETEAEKEAKVRREAAKSEAVFKEMISRQRAVQQAAKEKQQDAET